MNPLIPALIQSVIEAVTNAPDSAPSPDQARPPVATPAGMLRTIPSAAEKATMNPPVQGVVQMDGKPMRLAPASQIRDEHNRVVMPVSLQQPVLVRYMTDGAGNVQQVWILTQAEAQLPVKPKTQ